MDQLQLDQVLTIGAGVYLGFIGMTVTKWGLGFAQRALFAWQVIRAHRKNQREGR